jgi:hypothetical protein
MCIFYKTLFILHIKCAWSSRHTVPRVWAGIPGLFPLPLYPLAVPWTVPDTLWVINICCMGRKSSAYERLLLAIILLPPYFCYFREKSSRG